MKNIDRDDKPVAVLVIVIAAMLAAFLIFLVLYIFGFIVNS